MKIKFNEPYITGDELTFIEDVFKRKHFYGNGYYTQRCSDFLENYLNTDKVLITDSCTSALEISALLLRDWNNDNQEVILPSYTFPTTASSFLKFGYKLKFCDINYKDLMLDHNKAELLISENTMALVVVHYAGLISNMDELKEICDKYNIYLIEDAAQALGSSFKNRPAGTIGDLGCFSFHETKNIHCGLGGALVVNNEKFKDRADYIWERGTNRKEVILGLKDKYSWTELGGSYYPTELQSAMLYAQLKALNKNIKERKMLFQNYQALFTKYINRDIAIPVLDSSIVINFHAFWVLFKDQTMRDSFINFLKDCNISSYIGYIPLHNSKVGKNFNLDIELTVTSNVTNTIVRMPFHSSIQEAEFKYIETCVDKFFLRN